MCCTRVAENTGRNNYAKNRHLCASAQICRAISSQLSHVSTIGKKLIVAISPPLVLDKLQLINSRDLLVSLGHASKFQQVSRLRFVVLRFDKQHLIEGATYIRLGGHHVGHRPTF